VRLVAQKQSDGSWTPPVDALDALDTRFINSPIQETLEEKTVTTRPIRPVASSSYLESDPGEVGHTTKRCAKCGKFWPVENTIGDLCKWCHDEAAEPQEVADEPEF